MPTGARKHYCPKQAELPFRNGHFGPRRGSARKPNGERAGVAHTPRAALPERHPVHVTIKLRSSLPKLCQPSESRLLLAAFAAAKQRAGRSGKRFRLTHFAILNDHLHLLAESEDHAARGAQCVMLGAGQQQAARGRRPRDGRARCHRPVQHGPVV